MALGAPLLGAPVTMRSMIIGDTLGLDLFLHSHEGIALARHLGSLPWLFPLRDSTFPDKIVRVRTTPIDVVSPTPYEAMATYAPRTDYFWKTYFANDPYFLKQELTSTPAPDSDLPPVLTVPPVKNTWVVFGTSIFFDFFEPLLLNDSRFFLKKNSLVFVFFFCFFFFLVFVRVLVFLFFVSFP